MLEVDFKRLEQEFQALGTIDPENAKDVFTAKEFAASTGTHKRTAQLRLTALLDAGKIERAGVILRPDASGRVQKVPAYRKVNPK